MSSIKQWLYGALITKTINKTLNWAVVNVIQQEQSGEKEQFINKGDSIVKKKQSPH
jgi:hypothetical protein